MEIKVGQWYRFNNDRDKREWLKLVNKMLGNLKTRPTSLNIEVYVGYRLLKWTGSYVHYRTHDMIEYDGKKAITWSVKNMDDLDDHVDAISYALQSITKIDNEIYKQKGENKMKLIEDRRKNELLSAHKQSEKLISKYIEESDTVELLNKTVEAFKERDSKDYAELSWKNLFDPKLLSTNETENIKFIKDNFNDDIKKINDKYDELTQLFELTDTFEQKMSLLLSYGILEHLNENDDDDGDE